VIINNIAKPVGDQTAAIEIQLPNTWYGASLGGQKTLKCDILRVFLCPIL
jgi:hypothetical protein